MHIGKQRNDAAILPLFCFGQLGQSDDDSYLASKTDIEADIPWPLLETLHLLHSDPGCIGMLLGAACLEA